MLLNGGNFEGKRIIKKETFRMMTTPQIPESIKPGNQRWGLSVRVITDKNRLPIGAFGWSGAYGTHFWVDPELGYVAVYMLNLSGCGGSGAPTVSEFEACVASGVIK